jgi:hypothetical protein
MTEKEKRRLSYAEELMAEGYSAEDAEKCEEAAIRARLRKALQHLRPPPREIN